MILVANKSDLTEQVSTKMGHDFASEHGMHFIETSALTNTNIDELFKYEYYEIVPIKEPNCD